MLQRSPTRLFIFRWTMDDGVYVSITVEDSFPPNQEAYLPSTQLDRATPPWMVPGRPVAPQRRRNPPPSAPGRVVKRRTGNKKNSQIGRRRRTVRPSGSSTMSSRNLPASAHRVRGQRPVNWELDITSTKTIRPLRSTQTVRSRPQSCSHGISGSVSSTSYNPPSGVSEVEETPASSSSVSVINYPNPYRAPLAVLEEMVARSRARRPAEPLGPRVPLPRYRQPRLPFRQVNRRVVDERFVSEPFAYRPPQRIPARPMTPWSWLHQYRQIPIDQALRVGHEVVQIYPEDFVHMGVPHAGVNHDVLYQGPSVCDLTRFSQYSAFRRDFDRNNR